MFGTAKLGFAAMLAVGGAIVVPVVFFFVLAHMFNLAQDMRVVAESMAEVAMRLAQPETVARESIVTVGQAIRREVAAMGDGVERALARAAELEALVHNEVSALERAYNDNEVRIRDLLTELTNQRETLVNQAEQVRNAIASVHLDLAHDITSVGDLVADKVNEVAQRVTRSLTEKGEHITLALGHAGDSMIDALGERGSTLLDQLETTSDQATTAISSASDRLSASLNFKTEHVHDEFADLAARLQQMMTARLDQVAQNFSDKSSVTIEAMASRSQQMTESFTDTSNCLAESITARAEEVNTALRSTGDSLILDLSLRGGDVVSKLEQTGERITETISTRSDAVADSTAARISAASGQSSVSSGSPSRTRSPICTWTLTIRPSSGAPSCETAPSRKSARAGALTDSPVLAPDTISVAMNGRDASRMCTRPSCGGSGTSRGALAAEADDEQADPRTARTQIDSRQAARMGVRDRKRQSTSGRPSGPFFTRGNGRCQ